MWPLVLVSSAVCHLLKLAGLSVPRRVLDDRRVRHIAALLPVSLLMALVVMQTFSSGQRLALDARAAGLAGAALAVLVRAPFIVVIATACVVTALLRLAIH